MSLAYQVVGRGKRAVIAVHGWFGDERTFEPMLRAVDTASSTWLLPSLRGYGLSRDVDGEMTIDEAAADCIELADRMGFDRFSVVGHSMGGKVALKALCLAPARVEAVVGVAPVPASAVPFPPEVRAVFDRAATDLSARRDIIDHSTGRRLAGAWLDRTVAATVRSGSPAAIERYLTSWADSDFSEELGTREVPAMVVVGQHDPDNNETAMKETYGRHLPDLDLLVFENCGHYPPDETPIALATAIDSFLERSVPNH